MTIIGLLIGSCQSDNGIQVLFLDFVSYHCLSVNELPVTECNVIVLICYNADMSVTHEQAAADPERYQVLANGAIYDHEVKRIAGCPEGGTTAITQANSSELRKTWERQKAEAQLAAQAGMALGTINGSALETWAMIVFEQTGLAKDTEAGRASTKAAEFVGRAAGYLVNNRQQSGQNTQNIQVNVYNSEISRKIIDIMDSDT